nr:ABC transporter ATP-binding protein [uncultured bacterium]
MIEIRGIEKKFGRQHVLKGVNSKIKAGKITAILGHNGSGKTTLIKNILGLSIPDHGDIEINGERINGNWEHRSRIGYMSQLTHFPSNLKVKELFSMIKDIRGQNGNEEYFIELFDLKSELDKKLDYLSGGTKQKVNATLAFMFDSPILICDEPTVGLDPISLIHLKEILRQAKKEGKTILLITHILSFVEELCDEIIFLQEGVCYFQGTHQELKHAQTEDTLEKAIANMMIKLKNV